MRIPDYDDIAQTLPAFLDTHIPDASAGVALVTHSQGGLVLQRFLAWMLSEGRGRQLTQIRLIVMLVCPNEGSEYLRSIRAMAGFGKNPQAKALQVLNTDVGQTRRIVLRQIVNATSVDERHCPIPFHVYSGDSDNVVRRESAQSAFPHVGVLPGDHFTILNPETPGNLTFPVLKRHLLASDDTAARVPQPWVRARMADPPGRPIKELSDPFYVEVHRAIDAGAAAAGLPVLPTYVEREHDSQLRTVIECAASGRSGLALLIGESSTGKTRACWEAVQALPEGWRLWHPIDPQRPDAAINTLPMIGPRTVVWLNETQHYLLTPTSDLGERVAAGLRTLLSDSTRRPVLVLGTIWPSYWAELANTPRPGQEDPHAQARALLTGADIRVPDTFAGKALTALQEAARVDPRLAEAYANAEHAQVTQYLAGVPALLERYRNAPAPARALLQAAVDARRLGHNPLLPHALLRHAAAGYLTDQQWDEAGEQWLEQALAYATAPCRGARGPLTRVRPRPGQLPSDQPHYRLADYLEQYGRASRWDVLAPAELWDAFVAHAPREDLQPLWLAAHRRCLNRHAFLLAVAAAQTQGDSLALREVADVLHTRGRTD